jgi:hypothetical protein
LVVGTCGVISYLLWLSTSIAHTIVTRGSVAPGCSGPGTTIPAGTGTSVTGGAAVDVADGWVLVSDAEVAAPDGTGAAGAVEHADSVTLGAPSSQGSDRRRIAGG